VLRLWRGDTEKVAANLRRASRCSNLRGARTVASCCALPVELRSGAEAQRSVDRRPANRDGRDRRSLSIPRERLHRTYGVAMEHRSTRDDAKDSRVVGERRLERASRLSPRAGGTARSNVRTHDQQSRRLQARNLSHGSRCVRRRRGERDPDTPYVRWALDGASLIFLCHTPLGRLVASSLAEGTDHSHVRGRAASPSTGVPSQRSYCAPAYAQYSSSKSFSVASNSLSATSSKGVL